MTDQPRPSRPQPLYRRVAVELRRRIEAGEFADRLPTERTLAATFGVSIITVRAAVTRLVQEGLVERRQGSGTYVRPRLRSRIAIYKEVESDHPLAGNTHALQLRALRRFFRSQGYGVSIYQGTTAPGEESLAMTAPELLEDLDRLHFAGVIAWTLADPASWLEPIERRGVPVVGIGGTPCPYAVRREHHSIMNRAVRYLHAERGRRRLALMAWAGEKPEAFRTPDMWVYAFREALAAEDLPYDERWVPQQLMVTATGAGWSQLREIYTAHRKERPDGLIITDRYLLGDAMTAIQELGLRVPEDLAIVAHADASLAGSLPVPIARFGGDPADYVRRAAEMLLERIAGRDPRPADVAFPFQWYGQDIAPAPASDPAPPRIVAERGLRSVEP
ncbi:MAG: substrate-binding domain-containing protein [Phycisphaeraceae bacterium]